MQNDIDLITFLSGTIKLYIRAFKSGNFYSEEELKEQVHIQIYSRLPNVYEKLVIIEEYYETILNLQNFYKCKSRLYNSIENLIL